MANCQISAISDQCGPSSQPSQDLSTIPEGRVGQVCKEWLIREDGNLAYRLQNEEISQHYKGNRSKNRLVREDLPLAKHLQESELLQAQRVRANYEQRRNNQAENDEVLAQQLQRRIWLEEEKSKRSTEEADERFAQKLLQREKARQLRKRAQREKEQVERLSQQIGVDYGSESGSQVLSAGTPSPPSFQRILTEDEQELDLSEFCMPPPPGLTPGELKYFLEEQDAEIAQLLQHQELKRNKNPEKEKLAVIEAQDFELARMLQKMEKDRVRRIKEKMRAKQQSQQSSHHQDLRESGPSFVIEHGDNYQRTSTPISPQNSFDETQIRGEENEYDIPENHLLNEQDGDSITYEEPYQLLSQSNEARLQQPFHNIAMDLDPTYQRRLQSNISPDLSTSNLIESCVDDDDASSTRQCALAQTSDSLEKLHRSNHRSASAASVGHHMPITSTSSSRSSRTSSSSGQSAENRSQTSNLSANNKANHSFKEMADDDYAPPLPPRDVSLLARHKQISAEHAMQNTPLQPVNFLPPHHPQHPNRRNVDSQAKCSPNRASVYSTSSVTSVPIQGHRRVASMEKQKKEKHKSQDGCKTQ